MEKDNLLRRIETLKNLTAVLMNERVRRVKLKNPTWPHDQRIIQCITTAPEKEKPAGKGGRIKKLTGGIVSLWRRLSSPKWRKK